MARVRFHLVTAATALLASGAGAAIYILLTGEHGAFKFVAWSAMLMGFCYPSLLAAMKSDAQGWCALWLKRLARGA